MQQAIALQEAFQEAIRLAEPSVACILVSRSDVYQRWFGETPPNDSNGKLGPFIPDYAHLRPPDRDIAQFQELRKSVAKRIGAFRPLDIDAEIKRMYDLANTANVPESYGSGVVINEKGLILTAYHVVRDATKIYVRLPGGKGSYADVHAADPRSDLAVLRMIDVPRELRPLPRGDGGKVRKGQIVLTLANPFAAGYKDGQPSASWGIISNIRRRDPGVSLSEVDRARWTLHQYGTMLQIDARLNLGCSGGALIDLQGKLIGLTTAMAAIIGSETAGGYALPLDDALRRIVDILERGEEVEYGFLGVQLEPRGEEVRLSAVIKGSAAERAGLRIRDTLLSVNDFPIHDNEDLFLAVGTALAGTDVKIVWRRSGGASRSATVRLDKFYYPGKFIASQRPPAIRGVRVDFTSLLPQRNVSLEGIQQGVYVKEVIPDSPAAAEQLQDSIITHVNDELVSSPAEFYRAAAKATGPLELTIRDRSEQGGSRKIKLN